MPMFGTISINKQFSDSVMWESLKVEMHLGTDERKSQSFGKLGSMFEGEASADALESMQTANAAFGDDKAVETEEPEVSFASS
jgi:hypothetical protein